MKTKKKEKKEKNGKVVLLFGCSRKRWEEFSKAAFFSNFSHIFIRKLG